MQPFTTHTGVAAPLRRSNVDTDQIIPASFLKRITRTGFEDGLFFNWAQDADFVLNNPRYAGATILVVGPDFGIGSSREHAVWALQGFGFRCVIGSRFGDIFRNNAGKAGLLLATVPAATVQALWELLETEDPKLSVDLAAKQIQHRQNTWEFEIDGYTQYRLLEGLDDIGITLHRQGDIAAFEATRPDFLPTTLDAKTPRDTGPSHAPVRNV